MKGLTETAENILQKNADRFKGFADIYDSARPKMPTYPVKIIKRYLGRTPETVVDLGCGTGLSTLVFDDIEKFKKEVFDIFGGAHFEADFCYRMRIGVK